MNNDTTRIGPSAEEFAERVLAASIGWAETMAIYVGDRLGWYRSLAEAGPSTAVELATRTNTSPRYAREWLEQQAVNGTLMLERAASGLASENRYSIAHGPAEVLTTESSLNYMAPLARMFAASAAAMPALLDAYRSGGGVSWDQLGPDARESQADLNRP